VNGVAASAEAVRSLREGPLRASGLVAVRS